MAANAFMRDLKAFFKEKDLYKCDLIAGDQMRAMQEHQRRGDKPMATCDSDDGPRLGRCRPALNLVPLSI